MSAGLIPNYIEEYPLENLTHQHFLVIADEAVKSLDWKISFISETGIITYTNGNMFGRGYEVRIIIEEGGVKLQSSSVGGEMIDLGRNKKNIKELIAVLNQLKYSIPAEELDSKYQALSEALAPEEDYVLKLPPPNVSGKIKGILALFIPKDGYFAAPILVNINILIFILMVVMGVDALEPDNESLLNWGANFRPLTLDGQWWRLITSTFLHAGVLHLLLNMYALIYIGLLLEPRLGKLRFLSAYLLTGLTASITSMWWHDATVCVGASGAIFGMYGVFLAMLTTDLIEKNARQAFLPSIAIFVVYNLINGVKGNIDNAAHIGGLIGGIIIGYCLTPALRKPNDKPLNYSLIGLLTFLTVISCAWVYKSIPNDFKTYEADMQQFSSMEAMALEIYSLPKDTPKDKLLYEIKDRGIYYWNEDLKLLDDIEKLQLPDVVQSKTDKLKQYCNLRIKSYELIYKGVNEETDKYKSKIDSSDQKIQGIIDELKGK